MNIISINIEHWTFVSLSPTPQKCSCIEKRSICETLKQSVEGEESNS